MYSIAFARVHGPTWARLEQLALKRVRSGRESEEFVALYKEVTGHLAYLRAEGAPSADVREVSRILALARGSLTSAKSSSLRGLAQFFGRELPRAFFRVRWWAAGFAVLTLALAVTTALYLSTHPQAFAALGAEADLAHVAKVEFSSYYTEHAHSDFSAIVWTNNAWIALVSVGAGFTGVFPVYMIWQNAVNVGAMGAIMAHFGELPTFFWLIIPHGLLELTAIFFAAGAGFKLFWTILAPGPFPRAVAFAREGKQTLLVGFGLVGVLGLSALVEGFVTPSSAPPVVKVVIGALALGAFVVWYEVGGRRAKAPDEPILYAA